MTIDTAQRWGRREAGTDATVAGHVRLSVGASHSRSTLIAHEAFPEFSLRFFFLLERGFRSIQP